MGLRYTYGLATDDVLAIRDAAGNHYYVVQDVLHSVRGLVKRDGTWVRSLRYGPYGAVIADTASASAPSWELRYRWTGREYDSETGWYYFRARYFDPSVRRFVQEDPIGYGGGVNVYAYGDGAPLAGRDPSGLVMASFCILTGTCTSGGGGELHFGGGDEAFGFAVDDDLFGPNSGLDPQEQHSVTVCYAGSCTTTAVIGDANYAAQYGQAACGGVSGCSYGTDVADAGKAAAEAAYADDVGHHPAWQGTLSPWDPSHPPPSLAPITVPVGNAGGYDPGIWHMNHFDGNTQIVRFFEDDRSVNIGRFDGQSAARYTGYFESFYPYGTPVGVYWRLPAVGYVLSNGVAIFSADPDSPCGCSP